MKLRHMILIIILSSVGCATTSLTRYKSDNISNKTYSNIVIAVDGTDLDSQAKAENYGAKTLRNNFKAEVTAWHELFPPIQKYSPNKLWSKIREKDVDGILFVTYEGGSSSLESVLIPTTNESTSYTSATVNKVGSSDTYQAQATTHTTWTGLTPVTYNVYSMRTKIQFFDTATKQVIWIGGANTSGDAVALMPSLASKIVSTFKADKLMEPKRSEQIRLKR